MIQSGVDSNPDWMKCRGSMGHPPSLPIWWQRRFQVALCNEYYNLLFNNTLLETDGPVAQSRVPRVLGRSEWVFK